MPLSRWSRIPAIVSLVGLLGATGLTVLAEPAVAMGLKPQLRGVADRKGIPPSDYASVVNSFVVQVNWADLQPTPGADITDTDPLDDTVGNKIDQAIGYARARGDGVGIKIRVYAGINAPEWVKTLPVTSGAPGPFQLCDNTGTAPLCGTVGHFWEQNYRAAYANFQVYLATKYDGQPEIRDVAITGCSTVYAEPLMRQGSVSSNRDAYKAAGYNEADNEACERDQITAHQVWTQTRSSLALNVYQRWNDGSTPKFTNDENYTEAMAEFCRQALGDACVLGNNGIGKDGALYPCADIGGADWGTRDPENRMYTKISCAGAPIYFQTAAAQKIQSYGFTLDDVLAWAVVAGAGLVELPSGYNDPTKWIYLSPSALSCYDQEFEGGVKCLDTPPTAPMDVTVAPGTPPSSAVDLSWSASTDDFGVRGYQIWRDGAKVGATTGALIWTDGGLSADTTYRYQIYATDRTGQLSPTSDPVTIQTAVAPDSTAPTAPTGLAANATTSSVALSWQPSTDNVVVTGYSIFRNGKLAGTTAGTSFTDSTVAAGVQYSYTVQASDAAGNLSAMSSPLNVTTAQAADTQAPSAPTGLTAKAIDRRHISLTWRASIDNVGVVGYRIFRNGKQIATVTSTSYVDPGVYAGYLYKYVVRAYDRAGNISAASNMVQLYTNK